MWNTVLYKPLLNALAFLVSVVPGGDVGIAVILLTILVKLILLPLSEKQIRNQAAMNILAPELEKIKKSGHSKEEQAKLTFELYKKHKTNPFSGCLVVIPTLLVIIALYSVFIKELNFSSGLYSFVQVPENINMIFLGLVDLTKASIVLALLAGVSQYFQAYFMPKPPTLSPTSTGSFQASFSKSMNTQMKYIFPFIIAFIAYKYLGVVALYLITNNVFTMLQQIYVGKTEKKVLFEESRVVKSS
ncbi:MAG: YidC/Oxa1 family membrane protein insertase [Candidatus Parcubacteria bacterium]|nr:YidC/Oxa1 family membrane protein insertase [Candidatus Parcubacteria bacterium]